MREKFRQFMVGRYGTDGLNQALSIASIVMLLISLLTRISLFTWLGLVLLILCYYRSLSRNISKRTEENYRYYTLKDRVDGKFRGLFFISFHLEVNVSMVANESRIFFFM